MGFVRELKRLMAEEESKAIVPATFLAMAVFDSIPTPMDVGYFLTESWLNKNKLKTKHYWIYKYFNHYGWDFLWYMTLFGITALTGKTLSSKVKIGLSVVAAGALVGLAWRYVVNNRSNSGSVHYGAVSGGY